MSEREIKKYLSVVHQVAAGFLRKLPPNVLHDDLVAAGTYGLIDSLRRNARHDDPAFEYYIRIRIRGAIIDELRAQDWLPRRTRSAASAQQNNPEGASSTCTPMMVVSFDDLPSRERAANLADESAANPAESVEAALQHQALADAVQKLPDRERTIVTLHYFRGIKFKDIGNRLGVSEPRVSQLHARAMGRLRAMLEHSRAAA